MRVGIYMLFSMAEKQRVHKLYTQTSSSTIVVQEPFKKYVTPEGGRGSYGV